MFIQLNNYVVVYMLTQRDVQKHRKRFTEKDLSASALFKILGDTNRYRILLLLAGSPLLFSIGSIAKILDISLPLASQHIRLMVHAHVLQKKRDGKRVYITPERRNPLLTSIIKILKRT